MRSKPYDDERLGGLLRLLRAAPAAWVARAKRIPLGALTSGDLSQLTRRLEREPSFRKNFDADPVAAAQAAGMRGLAAHLQSELDELVALAERITRDAVFRAELADDPQRAVAAAGFAEVAAEPLLRTLAAPDEWLAKMPEVAAHRQEPLPPEARLTLVLLESKAVGEKLRSAARS